MLKPTPLLFTSCLHAFCLVVIFFRLIPRLRTPMAIRTVHGSACIIALTWVYAIVYHRFIQYIS